MKLKPSYYLAVVVLVLAGLGYAAGQSLSDRESRRDRQSRSDRESRSNRQSRSYRTTRSYATTPVPGPEDYAAFSTFIALRNIFNPDRFPHVPNTPINHPVIVNHSAPGFSFVGTMSYGKGMFAFFDGNDDEYRKSLQTSGTIAGYTVREIALGHVVLAEGSNTLTLAVGAVMRKARDGSWVESDENADFSTETVGAGNTNASTGDTSAAPAAPAAPVGEMSDILKKLMKQRELENK